jgi:serine/threonine protein kinase
MLASYELIKSTLLGGVYRKNDNSDCMKMSVKTESIKKFDNPEEEINIIKKLDHSAFVNYISDSLHGNIYYLKMEYINGGDLFDFIDVNGRVSDLEARHICSQLHSGLMYLLTIGYANLDISCENVGIRRVGSVEHPEEWNVCFLDVAGVCCILDSKESYNFFCQRSIPGKIGYMDPNLIEFMQSGGELKNDWDMVQSQVWSLGIIFYIIATGYQAYKKVNDEWFRSIISSKWMKFSYFANISPDTLQLIDSLLKPQKKRIPLSEIVFL